MSTGEAYRREYLEEKAEWKWDFLSLSEKVEMFEHLLDEQERLLPLAEQAEILKENYKGECLDELMGEWL